MSRSEAVAPGPAGARRGESQAARSPPPPLGQPLRLPGRGEWPHASRRSPALRSRRALCSRARNEAQPRREEAVRERGARKGPAAAGQRPPSSRRRAAAAGAPSPRSGPAPRSAKKTGRRSGARRGSASAFPLTLTLPARSSRGPPGAVEGAPRAPLCPRSRWPRRSPWGTGQRGLRRSPPGAAALRPEPARAGGRARWS